MSFRLDFVLLAKPHQSRAGSASASASASLLATWTTPAELATYLPAPAYPPATAGMEASARPTVVREADGETWAYPVATGAATTGAAWTAATAGAAATVVVTAGAAT